VLIQKISPGVRLTSRLVTIPVISLRTKAGLSQSFAKRPAVYLSIEVRVGAAKIAALPYTGRMEQDIFGRKAAQKGNRCVCRSFCYDHLLLQFKGQVESSLNLSND
jgi:hypothetical protein